MSETNSDFDNGAAASNSKANLNELEKMSEDVQMLPKFSLKPTVELLRGLFVLRSMAIEKPTHFQQSSIGPIACGRDVIAQFQSGTGKAATLSAGMLQVIDTQLRDTQALVLSPTRESAVQIQQLLLVIGEFMNVQSHACIGGTSLGDDINKLDYGQHIVLGTPKLVRGTLNFKQIIPEILLN